MEATGGAGAAVCGGREKGWGGVGGVGAEGRAGVGGCDEGE
jgi:hypothetical protein